MIKNIKVMILLLLASGASYAQTDTLKADANKRITLDGPMGHMPSPLYVIKHKKKEYVLDSIAMKSGILNPNSIADISVMKDNKLVHELYGDASNHGVILITLKEKTKPDAFKAIKKHLKPI
jgi:hypothetical protein